MEKVIIDKLALAYLRDKKLLVARSKGKDKFYLPGGKRESEETDQQALSREIKEELGVELIPESIKFMDAFEGQAHGKTEGTMVRLTIYDAKFNGEAKPCGEIEEIAYLTYEERHKLPAEWIFLFDWLKQKHTLV